MRYVTTDDSNRVFSTTPDKTEVRPTKELITWTVADLCRVLGRRSGAGRFRVPPPGSVLKEQARPSQSDPPRGPHSYSGLLGHG